MHMVFMYLEDIVDSVHLLPEGGQDLIELSHHCGIDCIAGSDVLEVLHHFKSSLSRAQRLERVVNKLVCLFFNQLHLLLKSIHLACPTLSLTVIERVKAHSLNVQHKSVDLL